MVLDLVINFASVLNVVVKWWKSLLSTRLLSFIMLKAVIFFLAYKYLPLLFGKFYQWIYNLGVENLSELDLSALTGFSWPEISGLSAWLFQTMQLDTVITILIAGAVTKLVTSPLPFMR